MGLFRKKKPPAPPGASPPTPSPAHASPGPAVPATPAASEPARPPANPAPAPAAGAPAGPATVTMVDGFGRPMPMPRAQWQKEVLPRVVEAYLAQPERLAAALLQFLRDGLHADILPAALRLCAVDPDPERCLSLLAAVQREQGDLEGALATIDELQQKRPQSATARVARAVVRDRQGDRAGATALLWEALQLDANHPDAVSGWLSFEQQRLGDPAYAQALDLASDLPRAWRARLWRARHALAQGRLEPALADYRAVLAAVGDESDALWMLAEDLDRHGLHEQFAELVLPRYRVDRHHPSVGILLLRHFQATKQPQRGLDLLHELRVRFQRALDSQLGAFDAEFTRLTIPALPKLDGPPKVQLYRFDRPLWFQPLGEPTFLLPPPTAGAMFAGLAVQSAQPVAQQGREDELGRLSRSVPLMLAENLWLGGRIATSLVLPVTAAGGWVVLGVPWTEERLAALLPEPERQRLRLVTGVVRATGQQREFELHVFDPAARQRLGTVRAAATEGKAGPAMLQLLGELSPLLGGPAALQPPVGNEVFWDRFATGLAQLAALVVAGAGAMPKDRVYGHRAILEWLLSVALDERRSVQARLLLAAGLCADAAIGSKVHRELAAPFAELFRQEPAQSPFAQVAYRPLQVLGLQALWQHRRQEIVASGSDAFRQWLQRQEAVAPARPTAP